MKSVVGIYLKIFSYILCALELLALIIGVWCYCFIVKERLDIAIVVVSAVIVAMIIMVICMIPYCLGCILNTIQRINEEVERVSQCVEQVKAVAEDTQFLCEQSIRLEQMLSSAQNSDIDN